MLDACEQITRIARDLNREQLESNETAVLALSRAVEIVGEAARALSQDERDKHSMIPWTGIIGARNRLIHAYWRVDLDVLWDIVELDVPQLAEHLRRILNKP